MKKTILVLLSVLMVAAMVLTLTACDTCARMGHTWGEGEITSTSDCGTDGEMTYKCTVCGTSRTEVIPATGDHAWGEWEPSAVEGEEQRECSVCHEVDTREVTTPGGHVCQDVCEECGKCLTECTEPECEAKCEGHTPPVEEPCEHESISKVDAQAHDCENDGTIEHWICDECGQLFADAEGVEELDDEDIVDPARHTYTELKQATKGADCQTYGAVAHYECEKCNKWFADDEAKTELPEGEARKGELGDHKLGEPVQEKEAKCDEAGHVAYYQCETCEKYFQDDEAQQQIEDIVIPAGHKLGGLIGATTGADCQTHGAVAHYECEKCNKWFADEQAATELTGEARQGALGNHVVDWESLQQAAKGADCQTQGTIAHYECSKCGQYFDTERHEIDSIAGGPVGDHKLGEPVAEQEAKCGEEGHVAYYQCEKCETYFSDSEAQQEIDDIVIPAKQHSYANAQWTHDEDDAFGVHHRVCDNCGQGRVEEACSIVENKCSVCEKEYSTKEIVEEWFDNGRTPSGTFVLTGTVTRFYSTTNKNSPFILIKGFEQYGEIECYQLANGTPSYNDILVGCEITVSGTLTVYNGTKEFAQGSKLVSIVLPTYTVDIDDSWKSDDGIANVTYTELTAKAGTTITITVEVEEDYIAKVVVTLESGETVPVTVEGNRYSFTLMGNVTVTITAESTRGREELVIEPDDINYSGSGYQSTTFEKGGVSFASTKVIKQNGYIQMRQRDGVDGSIYTTSPIGRYIISITINRYGSAGSKLLVEFADNANFDNAESHEVNISSGSATVVASAYTYRYVRIVENSDINTYIASIVITYQGCTHDDLTEHAEDPSTCETKGTAAYWECNECGKLFADADCTEQIDEPQQLELAAHKLQQVGEQDAKCTETGLQAHYECSECGALFRDEQGLEPVEREELVIEAKGHSYSELDDDWIPDPENPEHHYRVCSECSEGRQDGTCDTDDWNYDDHDHWFKCSVCGYEYDDPELKFEHSINGAGVCTDECGYKNENVAVAVEIGEESWGYNSLLEAIASLTELNNNETVEIILYKHIVDESFELANGSISVTINLNGFSLTVSEGYVFTLSGGDLTIEGSAIVGTILYKDGMLLLDEGEYDIELDEGLDCVEDALITIGDNDLEHNYGAWVKLDETEHQQTCARCGDVVTDEHTLRYDEKKDLTHHVYCEDCDYSETVAHNFGTGDKSDRFDCVCGEPLCDIDEGTGSVTFTSSTHGTTATQGAASTFTVEDGGYEFTLKFEQGTHASINPAYYSPNIRIYNGNKLTISAPEHVTITKIEFTLGQGAFTGDGYSNKVWSGTATEVVLSNTSSTQVYLTSLKITYSYSIPTGHHVWDEGVEHEATCTEDAYTLFTCIRCGDTKTETDVGTATGHTFTDKIEWSWAQDHTSATATLTCDECDESIELTDSAPRTNIVTARACEVDEVVTYTASVQYEYSDAPFTVTTDNVTLTGTRLEHQWGAWTPVEGEENHQHACLRECGATQKDAHSSNDGWKWNETDHWYVCSECQAEYGKEQHNFNGGDTCETCGAKEGSTSTPETVEVWKLVEDASTLKAGDQIIIVSGGYALGTNQGSNNRDAVSVTVADDRIETISDSVQVITLESGTNGSFALYVEGTSTGYLYAVSGNNYLRTKATKDNTCYWNITISSKIASIACVGVSGYYLQKNNSSAMFSGYKNTQTNPQIFRLTEEIVTGGGTTTPQPTDPDPDEPTGPVTVTMTSFSVVNGSLVDTATGRTDSYITYSTAKGDSTSDPAINGTEIRIYQAASGKTSGGSITITAANGKKIKSIIIGSSMATSVKYSVDAGADSSSKSISANGKLTVSDLDASSITFTCVGTSSSSRLYVNYIQVIYE